VLIITGGFLVAGGILRLANVPPDWSEYDITVEFPKEVSYTSLMACLDSVPEIKNRFRHKPIISVTITEAADDERWIQFNPVPSSTEEIKSALEKQLKAKIVDEHTSGSRDFSPLSWSPLSWLVFTLAFLVWPALLFLGAGQLIKFYRSSA
jgi:hypothetical protein